MSLFLIVIAYVYLASVSIVLTLIDFDPTACPTR